MTSSRLARVSLLAIAACGSPPRPPSTVEPVGQLAPPSPDERARFPDPMKMGTMPPPRCTIRIVRGVITVDGDPVKRAQAVALCKQHKLAMVELVDAASEAEWLRLQLELFQVDVLIMTRPMRRDGA